MLLISRFSKALLLALLLFSSSGLSAQPTSELPADSVKYGYLPALGYSSDTGFVGGGLVSRYHYREGVQPFQSFMQSAAIATTKGLFSFLLAYDQVETFGYPVRTRSQIEFGRILETTYFGLGNDSSFDDELWKDGYYFFENYFVGLQLGARKVIWENPERKGTHLDLLGIVDFHRISPQTRNAQNLLVDQNPDYIDGTWLLLPGIGLQWENSDSEFAATRGNKVKLELRASPGLVSPHALWNVQFFASQYASAKIIFPVTAAFRVNYNHAGGDVPFWFAPYAGGEYSIRGYPQNRFRGDAALSYSAELRTWLIQVPSAGFRLGGHLFTDGGRVYESDRIIPDFFKEHHRTLGLGSAMSLFTYDFIVRADLGFSDEMSRFYLGIGYTF